VCLIPILQIHDNLKTLMTLCCSAGRLYIPAAKSRSLAIVAVSPDTAQSH
jgi:hypothetical protein